MNPHHRRIRAMLPGLLLVATSLPSTTNLRAQTLTLVVSPQGNDRWSGRLDAPNPSRTDGPLATLAGARDAVRKMKKNAQAAGPITILVRGGSYELVDTLRFPRKTAARPALRSSTGPIPANGPSIRGGRRINGVRHSSRLDPQGRPGRAGSEGGDVQGALLRRPAAAAGTLSQLRSRESVRRRLGLRRRQARADVPGPARRGSAHASRTRRADRRTWSKPERGRGLRVPPLQLVEQHRPDQGDRPRHPDDQPGGGRLLPDPPRRPLLLPQCPRGAGRPRRVVSRPGTEHALRLASRARSTTEHEIVAPTVGTLIARRAGDRPT